MYTLFSIVVAAIVGALAWMALSEIFGAVSFAIKGAL